MHCLIRDYQDFTLMQNVEPTVHYFSCKKSPAKQNTWKLGPKFSGPLGQLMALGNPHWINDSQNINHELILELAFTCKKSSGLVLIIFPMEFDLGYVMQLYCEITLFIKRKVNLKKKKQFYIFLHGFVYQCRYRQVFNLLFSWFSQQCTLTFNSVYFYIYIVSITPSLLTSKLYLIDKVSIAKSQITFPLVL